MGSVVTRFFGLKVLVLDSSRELGLSRAAVGLTRVGCIQAFFSGLMVDTLDAIFCGGWKGYCMNENQISGVHGKR
jgi:hypothetical protein